MNFKKNNPVAIETHSKLHPLPESISITSPQRSKRRPESKNKMEENHIYQYSLLNALMDGVCETGIPASQLAKKGNQGLGTFTRMQGELILLDGKIYRLLSHGNVKEASSDDEIPFAVVTNFVSQSDRPSVDLKDKRAIDDILDDFSQRKAKNLFLTFRLHGRFEYLKCRTVAGQEYKGQPLSELGKKQTVEEYDMLEGTIIGFRTPKVSSSLEKEEVYSK